MAGPRGGGCPVCGAPIRPLAPSCDACGYGYGSLSGTATGTPTDDDPSGTARKLGACRHCGSEVAQGATYCPHCGTTVRDWRLVPMLLMIVGFCLTASIIGAIVGIPMQLLALRLFREAREGTVVREESA